MEENTVMEALPFDIDAPALPAPLRYARNRGDISARTYRLDAWTIHAIETYAKTMRISYSQAVQDMIESYVSAVKTGAIK